MTSTISVIIPAFNAARTLGNAVASVRRQGWAGLEIIVVDDGSVDDTARVCAALGADLRYHHQPNAGVAAARNAGLDLATADRIAFLDADDEWCPGRLRALDAALTAHPTWGGVQGRTQCVRADAGPLTDAPRHGEPWYPPSLPSALIGRAAFAQVGRFDPTLRLAEDLDWFIRAREAGCVIGRIEETTSWYRLHAGSLTRGRDPQEKNLLVTMKRAIDRRRAAAGSAPR